MTGIFRSGIFQDYDMRSLFFSLTEIPPASILDLKYVLTKVQKTKGRMAFVTGKKVGTWALLMMV